MMDADNTPEPGSLAGSRFGPYHLKRLLGRGLMGEVYEADHGSGDTPSVAVKLISEQFSGSAVYRLRMQGAADAVARLTEPHVVPINRYGEIGGRVYVEMPLIRGIDLGTLLGSSGPLSLEQSVSIVSHIAAALDAAHHAGVVHRDLKPENILVAVPGLAYLMDLAVAGPAADPGLTQTDTTVSNYNYMAPERLAGDHVTHLVDIYALACVLVECLTGSPPYRIDSAEQAVEAHLAGPSPQPSVLRPGVPVAFDGVIARGMAKRPDDRYRSAGELAAAAREAAGVATEPGMRPIAPRLARPQELPLTTAPQELPPIAAPQKPGGLKPVLIGAAALVVAAVVAAAGHMVTQPPRPRSVAAPQQTVLPFTGLSYHLSPGGVALDPAGNVYVTSQGMTGRVMKLPARASTPLLLPFNGLYQPQGVAVDSDGAVYVADLNDRVVKLAPGSDTYVVLPFTGLVRPGGVAVDAGGSVYVVDRGNDRVLILPSGSDTATVLPFTGLDQPAGVAVDGSGSVYVTDTGNNRVLKLQAWSNSQTELPLAGIAGPWGVATDDDDNIYVTERDNQKVVRLKAGSIIPAVLPFTGLNTPLAVAVDGSGTAYVADRGNDRVVTIPGTWP